MNITEEYKKEVCQCRNPKCRKVFHQTEIKHIHIERFGQQATDAVCPYCDSTYFGLIDYPVTEEELLYKNGKFYPNHNRELKLHMDQVVDEILEKDRIEYKKRIFIRSINEERKTTK